MPDGLDASADARLAVVDLGSNSFRLVVFGVHAAAPDSLGSWWKRIDEIYEPVRIGAGVDESGALGEAGIARAIAAIEVFSHFCRAAGLSGDEIDAVATSAIREATNSEHFLELARRAAGMEIRVLSREEEARAGYLAAVNSTDLRDGAVLDLGGGSMQLVEVEGREARTLDSWRLGAVRMTERFLPGRRAGEHQAGRAAARTRRAQARGRAMARHARPADRRRRRDDAQPRRGRPARARAAVVRRPGLRDRARGARRARRRARTSVAGRAPALSGDQALARGHRAGGRDRDPVGARGRRRSRRSRRRRPGCARASSSSARWPGAGRRSCEDVRRASVVNLAAQYDATPAHTRHVARLALGLFDELAAAGLHEGDGLERELLEAAALLHDIGVAVDYDDHHKHSRYLVLNAGLPGFTPREVALIGQTVRYHRKGSPEFGPFEPLMRRGDDAAPDALLGAAAARRGPRAQP